MRFWIKQGDRDPALEVTLTDNRNQVVNLTNASSGRLLVRDRDDNVVIVTGAITFVDRPNGVVRYSWAAGDTIEAGVFDAEVEITDSGKQQTYPTDGFIEIIIAPSVDGSEGDTPTAGMIYELRRAVGEVGETTYLDANLLDALTRRDMELEAAAYDVWTWKASDYANLVDVSESGSSRKLSQLYTQALQMAEMYGKRSAIISSEVVSIDTWVRGTRTRAIVRE